MIVSNAYEFIFVEIPKNASRSVGEMLLREYQGTRVAGSLFDHPKIKFKVGHTRHTFFVEPCWANYLKFAIVRNPYDRAVSAWQYASPESSFDNFVAEFYSDGLVETNLFRKHPSFACNQSDFEDQFGFDVIVRYENLESDLQNLPFVNKPLKLNHIGKSNFKKSGCYNTWTEHEVYSWALQDFERYGYERMARFE